MIDLDRMKAGLKSIRKHLKSHPMVQDFETLIQEVERLQMESHTRLVGWNKANKRIRELMQDEGVSGE